MLGREDISLHSGRQRVERLNYDRGADGDYEGGGGDDNGDGDDDVGDDEHDDNDVAASTLSPPYRYAVGLFLEKREQTGLFKNGFPKFD